LKEYLGLIKKNRTAQALLALLVAVALADAGFYALKSLPADREVSEVKVRLGSLAATLTEKKGELARYESFDKGKAEVGKFMEGLPKKSDYTSIIRRMYLMARTAGVRVNNFSVERAPVKGVAGTDELKFAIPISGGYQDVRRFLYEVENSDLFLNINSVSIASAGDSKNIYVSVVVSTYLR